MKNQMQIKPLIQYFFILVLLTPASMALAVDPAATINSAGVVNFPTALNQTNNNMLHLTLDVFDIGEPDLRVDTFRYGHQWGDIQLLLDLHSITRPETDFDYGEFRVKLRVLPLDEIRSTIAIGLLSRYADSPEGNARLDDRRTSFLAVMTNQFYLFGSLETMTNWYVDNVFANFGIKLEIYQFIMMVAESDYYHSMPDALDRTHNRIGFEVDGEQNFYFQLFFSDKLDNVLLQIGSGF